MAQSPLRRSTAGAVYIEFLLAFFPLFTLFLGLLQLSMIYTANLLVSHAAQVAARAAVVVIDDDPLNYPGQPARGSLIGGGAGSPSSKLQPLIASNLERGPEAFPAAQGGSVGTRQPAPEGGNVCGPAGTTTCGGSGSQANARWADIRLAAWLPLLFLAPSEAHTTELAQKTVLKKGNGGPMARARSAVDTYNRTAVAVNFPAQPGSNACCRDYYRKAKVTVRVTYLFPCTIPIGHLAMCDSAWKLRSRGGEGASELESAEDPWSSAVMSIPWMKFKILRAEASLPNQDAGYAF